MSSVRGCAVSPTLLISACLAGRPVRWDGGDTFLSCLADTHAAHMAKFEVCPEMRAGFGTPRMPLRLWKGATQRIVVRRAPEDCRNAACAEGAAPEEEGEITARLDAACIVLAEEAIAEGICGAVLKSRSPSCALYDAQVFSPAGPTVYEPGVFVRRLKELAPGLPLIDDAGLRDKRRANRFFAAVAAYGMK